MKFKDYEYGWYGHVGFNNLWWNSACCYMKIYNGYEKPRSFYNETRTDILKQLPKIQTVKFIYGDYREV